MADKDPTIEDLQKQIETLEADVDELRERLRRIEGIEKACYDLAQKLAKERGEPLIDWWCPV
jgi:predicted nuclease with TOPRIM domain